MAQGTQCIGEVDVAVDAHGPVIPSKAMQMSVVCAAT